MAVKVLLNKIKVLRRTRRISQSQMAHSLSVTQTTISKWESGERIPDANTICVVADYFNVSTDYLLNRVSEIQQATSYTDYPLTAEDVQFLKLYHSLNIFNQKEAIGFLRGLSTVDIPKDTDNRNYNK